MKKNAYVIPTLVLSAVVIAATASVTRSAKSTKFTGNTGGEDMLKINRREFLISSMPLLTAPLLVPMMSSPSRASLFAPEGTFEKVWFEERVQVNRQLGIQIHAKYNIRNARGLECRIRATFFTSDGAPIVAPPKSEYATGNGNAGVTKFFTPKYDNSVYADTKLGIPYWALNLKESNPNKMKFHVTLRCDDKTLATSDWFNFSLPIGKVR